MGKKKQKKQKIYTRDVSTYTQMKFLTGFGGKFHFVSSVVK